MSNLFEKVGSVIVSIGLAIGGFFGYVPEPQVVEVPVETETLGADTVLPIAGAVYYLAGTGISSSATSFTLTSFTIPQNGKKILDSEMSDTFYVTFEPGNRTRQEVVSCTTVTQNADDTATISGCSRGLSPVTPYTASTSLQFAHAGGSTVIFSNPPQLFNQVAIKGNDETITGQWTFDVFPITASTSIASATTSGIAELATGEEAASSTLEGDIGAGNKLVLHTGISTSSAPASGNVVVVTGDDGNIDYNFLPQLVGSSTVWSTTTSGTYTKPTNLKHVIIECQGAGGNGGYGAAGGAGGGGGAYTRKLVMASLISATTSVTVGTAGLGSGSTTIGSLLGCANGTNASGNTQGTGGSATGGDVNISGQSGGTNPNTLCVVGGAGGSSVYGRGAYASTYNGDSTTAVNGYSATGYGGGGGGGSSATDCDPDATAGGSGTGGLVIITEYF